MRIVDTHTHVVSADAEKYPLQPAGLPGRWYLEAPHSADDLATLMAETEVARAVLVQGVGAYSYDNRYASDAALADPARFWSACCVDPTQADAPASMRRWVVDQGMDGARFFALERGSDPSWLTQPKGEALWEEARALGLHVIVTVFFHQLDEVSEILRRYPDIAISLDHCGFPPIAAERERALESLRALAQFDQLHLKISTHVLDAAASSGDLGGVMHQLVEDFGAERLMWGSDFCQTYDRAYSELVALAQQAFAQLPVRQQEQILGGTAESLWDAARSRTSSIRNAR